MLNGNNEYENISYSIIDPHSSSTLHVDILTLDLYGAPEAAGLFARGSLLLAVD